MKYLLAALLSMLILFALTRPSAAEHERPIIVVRPDSLTGEFTFKMTTSTDDPRLIKTCLYRIDANSPDPMAPVACADVLSGRAPVGPEEQVHSGEGVVLEFPVTIGLPTGQTQEFGVRNVIIGPDGEEMVSELSANKAVLPRMIGRPLFLFRPWLR